MNGVEPLLVDGREVFLNIQDKDLDKVRSGSKRSTRFLPALRTDDLDGFRRVKTSCAAPVMRPDLRPAPTSSSVSKAPQRTSYMDQRRPPPRSRTGVPLEAVGGDPGAVVLDDHEKSPPGRRRPERRASHVETPVVLAG